MSSPDLSPPSDVRDPDGWMRTVVAVWIGQAASAIAFSFILPFIPLYVQTLGATDQTDAARWAGWISAASAVSMVVAQPIWGAVADRYGRKPMLVRSMLGGAVVIGLMGFAQSPLQLLVLRFVQGGVTGVVAAATALVSATTPKRRLGLVLGLMQVAMFTGTSVGPLVGGFIADTLGYRQTFYASGALLLAAGLSTVTFVRERFVRPPVPEARRTFLAGSRALASLRLFPTVVVVIFLIQAGQVVVSPVLTLYIAQISGATNAATVAGAVLAATGVASAISAVLIARTPSASALIAVCGSTGVPVALTSTRSMVASASYSSSGISNGCAAPG